MDTRPLPLDCTTSIHTSSRSPEVLHAFLWKPRHQTTSVCPPRRNHTRGNRPGAPPHIGVVGLVSITSVGFAARDLVSAAVRADLITFTSQLHRLHELTRFPSPSRGGASLCLYQGRRKYEPPRRRRRRKQRWRQSRSHRDESSDSPH